MSFLNDPVHGQWQITALLDQFRCSAAFERLGKLRQLGSCSNIFPNATHTRMSHSLGVSHLARMFTLALQQSEPDLKEYQTEFDLLEIAGACHDLGHGPFGHMFQDIVVPTLLGEDLDECKGGNDRKHVWEHEQMSIDMVQYIIDLNGIDLDGNHISFIKQAIQPQSKSFLFDIVANTTHGIDIDKMDYIRRDMFHLGMSGDEWVEDSIFRQGAMKIVDGTVGFHISSRKSMRKMLRNRRMLHETVYKHSDAMAVSFMVSDALVHANSYLRLDECIFDVEKYVNLDDSVLDHIWMLRDMDCLKESRRIIERLRCRDFYAPVAVFQVKSMGRNDLNCEEMILKVKSITALEIANRSQSVSNSALIWYNTRIDCGKAAEDPLDSVVFFGGSVEEKDECVSHVMFHLYCREGTVEEARKGLLKCIRLRMSLDFIVFK